MKRISLIIFSLILIFVITVSIIIETRHNYAFVEVDSQTRQQFINILNEQCTFKPYIRNKKQARKKLESEFDFNNYIYREGHLKNANGVCKIPIRFIKIKSDITIDEYYRALAHEMCHIKYFTGNELYIQFMTFKGLYESEDSELKEAGLMLGIEILNKNYPQEYDCSQLIINYLVEENTNNNRQ